MLESFKQHLRDQNQSVTGPRLAVFQYIAANDPTTVAQVIASQSAGMDRASVYRTLTLFRKLGVIQDIVTGGRRMLELTDAFDSHHHHVSCTSCGAIRMIEDPELEQRLAELARSSGFEPRSHQIEVTGVCASCRQLAA